MKSARSIAQLMIVANILFILRPSLTKLTARPRNGAVDVGRDVIIGCSSDVGRRNGSWTRFADDGRVELFLGGRKVPGIDEDRFQMASVGRGGGRLDLTVRRARVEDAGLYVCSDGEQHASAHLLVVTSPPTCSGTSPREL